MAHTTRPPIVNITEVFPELAAYARPAVRLHPRRGTPGVHDSHIGGPMLWPTNEPWPFCQAQHERPLRPDEPPVAMVPIAQLNAADVPSLPFPDSTDLLQVLWCPHEHAYDQMPFPTTVRWRCAAEVTDVLPDPPQPRISQDGLTAIPCVLDPEPITEYPWAEELPKDLQDRIHAWEGDYPAYQYGLSIAPGCKAGGGMSFAATDMGEAPTCEECGAPAAALLQLDSTEWGGESDREAGPPRWQPLEDAASDVDRDAYWDALEPTGLLMGRCDHGSFFVCTADQRHPVPFYWQ